MPHDMMNTIHESMMPGSHHLLFWGVVAAVFALLLFAVWWFGRRSQRSR